MYKEPKKNNSGKSESLFSRIAKSDNETLKKVQNLFSEYGIPKATDRYDLYRKLLHICKKEKDNIIPKLVEIHPDRKIFEAYYQNLEQEKIDKIEKEKQDLKNELESKIKELNTQLQIHSSKHYSDDGTNESKNKVSDYLPLLSFVGVMGIVSLAFISINQKNK